MKIEIIKSLMNNFKHFVSKDKTVCEVSEYQISDHFADVEKTPKNVGKVILITGATSGIGNASLGRLVKDGHIVYGTYRKKEESKLVSDLGGISVHMEMTEEDSLKKAVKKIISEQGHIDVLWNNAGYGLYGPMEDIPMESARHEFDVNLFGLARLTQLVLPYMRKAKKGLIINTSSVGGKVYMPLGAWYHASKHALEGWSDCMRLDLKQFGINVVILEPGLIETNFYAVAQNSCPAGSQNGPYKKIVRAMQRSVEHGVKGSPPELIADTVSKIVSSENPKTRYLVGKFARPLVFIRKWFGDRMYDRVIMARFK